MIDSRRKYYDEMLAKGRLIPIIIEDRFLGFITFYITNYENRFNNVDPWAVLEDDPNGNKLYIAQLMTDSNRENPSIFLSNWNGFIKYIKNKFPNIKYIFWRRWNKRRNVVVVHKKEI